jgi:hypothetical protein
VNINKLILDTDLNRNLKKIVVWKFNTELVNDSWLKFYEILAHENLVSHNLTKFKSFHIHETTGAQIFALNHYIVTHTNIKSFEWLAECQNYDVDFVGKYDLYELFPTRWVNTKGNLISSETCLKDVRLNSLDLIICETKLTTEFERDLLHMIFTVLQILPKNKSFIIKMFIPITDPTVISTIYLLTRFFKTVKMVKPTSSSLNSSELFCICKNYTGYENIDMTVKNRLNNQLNKASQTDQSVEITVNKTFFDNIVKINELFVDKQINFINELLFFRKHYYCDYDLQKNVTSMKDNFISNWCLENDIKPISREKKILKI